MIPADTSATLIALSRSILGNLISYLNSTVYINGIHFNTEHHLVYLLNLLHKFIQKLQHPQKMQLCTGQGHSFILWVPEARAGLWYALCQPTAH